MKDRIELVDRIWLEMAASYFANHPHEAVDEFLKIYKKTKTEMVILEANDDIANKLMAEAKNKHLLVPSPVDSIEEDDLK